MNYLFFTGGPGFHALAEEEFLKDFLNQRNHQIKYWLEPSINRKNLLLQEDKSLTSLNFDIYCKYAKKFLLENKEFIQDGTLIFHSFSFHIYNYLFEIINELGAREIILLAPAMDLYQSDLNIINTSINDFKNLNMPDQAKALEEKKHSLTKNFSINNQKAFEICLLNTTLFTHYFEDLSILQKYFSFYANEPYQYEANNFFSIKLSMPEINLKKSNLPTKILIGENDIITENYDWVKLRQFFSDLEMITLPTKSHFFHIENKDRVFK